VVPISPGEACSDVRMQAMAMAIRDADRIMPCRSLCRMQRPDNGKPAGIAARRSNAILA